jgi:hypothetical protein
MAKATLARGTDGRLVVLKTPLTDDPALNARLRDEGKVGLLVKHPHLVETIESLEHGGRPVVVVEFIRGVSVAELRKSGRLGVAAVARIGRQIASALQAMHTARDAQGVPLGIVHRDVSAGNILVDTKGDAILIDLGIAKFDGTRAASTNTGDVIGTLRYLAPELLDGEVGSAACDIWSLGCVLAEAATGRPVFEGKAADVLANIIRFTSYEESGLDARLKRLLQAMLHRSPTQRATAADVIKVLTDIEAAERGGASDLADLATASLNQTQRVRPDATAPTATQPADAHVVAAPARRHPMLSVLGGAILMAAGFAGGTLVPAAEAVEPAAVVRSRPGPDVLPAIVNVFSNDADCVAGAVAWRQLREQGALPAGPVVNYPNGMPDARAFAVAHHLGPNVMSPEDYSRIVSPPPVNHFRTMVVDRDGIVRWSGSPQDASFAEALRRTWATVAEEDRTVGVRMPPRQPAPPPIVMPETVSPDAAEAKRLMLIKEHTAALKVLDAAIKARPDDAELYRLRGICAATLRLNDLARASYERFLELAPDGPQAETVRVMLRASERADATSP